MDKYTKLLRKLRMGLASVGKIDVQQKMLNDLEELIKCNIVDKRSPMFTDFIKDFFEYKQSVEIDLQYSISIINGSAVKTNPIEYFKFRSLIRKLTRTFQNLNDFHIDFYKTYGFSLSHRMSKIADVL